MVADLAAYALALGREIAEELMPDACRITRGADVVATDPVTGAVTTTPNVVYEGECRVQSWAAQESTPEAATAVFTVERYTVSVPVAKTAAGYQPMVGDDVTITASENDPHLVGRTFQVMAPLNKSRATAYRLAVEKGP
ncbi:DUF6093 family protein [Isoptericola sp. NPDC056605]|uniref:DUF6093 family protein n=1 Tax=Isoptericola sp. NPDC056605 TaxID=3345876 RepID=UPI0036B49832